MGLKVRWTPTFGQLNHFRAKDFMSKRFLIHQSNQPFLWVRICKPFMRGGPYCGQLLERHLFFILHGFVATVRKQNLISTTCSNSSLSINHQKMIILATFLTCQGSPVILNIYQTHLCQFFLIWRSQGFLSHSLPFLSRTSVTSFQQVLLEAATHVIEELIFSQDLPRTSDPFQIVKFPSAHFYATLKLLSHMFYPEKVRCQALLPPPGVTAERQF